LDDDLMMILVFWQHLVLRSCSNSLTARDAALKAAIAGIHWHVLNSWHVSRKKRNNFSAANLGHIRQILGMLFATG
jgi:hypothetical protein